MPRAVCQSSHLGGGKNRIEVSGLKLNGQCSLIAPDRCKFGSYTHNPWQGHINIMLGKWLSRHNLVAEVKGSSPTSLFVFFVGRFFLFCRGAVRVFSPLIR